MSHFQTYWGQVMSTGLEFEAIVVSYCCFLRFKISAITLYTFIALIGMYDLDDLCMKVFQVVLGVDVMDPPIQYSQRYLINI